VLHLWTDPSRNSFFHLVNLSHCDLCILLQHHPPLSPVPSAIEEVPRVLPLLREFFFTAKDAPPNYAAANPSPEQVLFRARAVTQYMYCSSFEYGAFNRLWKGFSSLYFAVKTPWPLQVQCHDVLLSFWLEQTHLIHVLAVWRIFFFFP
jgi:hypothetical protein